MLKLTITFLVGAITFASLPALAVELPDYGSKNFSPPGDTPSYFANETAPVSSRTADTTPRDWSAVDEMAPARASFEGSRSVHGHRRHHGRYPVVQNSGRHGAGRYGGKAVRATSPKHGRPSARHANSGVAHYTVN